MRIALAVSLATAACSGGSSFDDVAAGVTGIYHVQDYTLNEQVCEPGGTSQLGSDGFAIATTHDFGLHVLTVISCASPGDCRQKQAASDAGQGFAIQFGYTVHAVGPGGSLLGEGADTGSVTGGGRICAGGSISATTLGLTGTALRIEKAITPADDYPQAANGFCTTDSAKVAAIGNACSRFELLTADFAEDL
jgi:hypothetical protein